MFRSLSNISLAPHARLDKILPAVEAIIENSDSKNAAYFPKPSVGGKICETKTNIVSQCVFLTGSC